jgi:hypothetical protein
MAIAAPFPSVRATPRPAHASTARPSRPARASTARPSRPLRLTRRGRAVLFLAASSLLAGVVIGSGQWAGASDASGSAASGGPATAVVVVQPGESLWSIAQAVAPGADPRETVLRLRELNGMADAVVVPGQSLVVPRF